MEATILCNLHIVAGTQNCAVVIIIQYFPYIVYVLLVVPRLIYHIMLNKFLRFNEWLKRQQPKEKKKKTKVFKDVRQRCMLPKCNALASTSNSLCLYTCSLHPGLGQHGRLSI